MPPAARTLSVLPVPAGADVLAIVPALRDALAGRGPARLPVPGGRPGRDRAPGHRAGRRHPTGPGRGRRGRPHRPGPGHVGIDRNAQGRLAHRSCALAASAAATRTRLAGNGSDSGSGSGSEDAAGRPDEPVPVWLLAPAGPSHRRTPGRAPGAGRRPAPHRARPDPAVHRRRGSCAPRRPCRPARATPRWSPPSCTGSWPIPRRPPRWPNSMSSWSAGRPPRPSCASGPGPPVSRW